LKVMALGFNHWGHTRVVPVLLRGPVPRTTGCCVPVHWASVLLALVGGRSGKGTGPCAGRRGTAAEG